MKTYSPYQFSIFRILLGSYIMFHFIFLIPFAAEIWGANGMLPDPTVNLTYGVFPNILNFVSSATSVTLYICVLTVLGFCFLIGFQRPIVSILLWYGWASLFDRNNLINNPGIPYVGWLLLACAVIPGGEPLSISTTIMKIPWEMPKILFWGSWAIMAVGYTISGFDKFSSPSWRNGTTIYHLLENPLARDYWLRDLMLQFPEILIKVQTWAILLIEMAFLPLALFKPTRKWIWLAMIMVHLGILLIVDFADLTMGMLMIHWFTFDSTWLKPKPKQSGLLFFDGICSMCNGLINFLMSEDKHEVLRYAPLQGVTAQENVDSKYLENINSIVFKHGDKIYTESNGIIQALASMGGIYKLILITKVIPQFLRDGSYALISKNRYKWFGKKDACRMPTAEERDKLLP